MKVYTIALGLYLLMGERNSCVPSQRVGATAVELKGCVVGSPFITEQQCLHRREREDCSLGLCITMRGVRTQMSHEK